MVLTAVIEQNEARKMAEEEYSEMLSQAKNQFKNGTPLFGKEGAFHRVLEDFLNAALDGEMDAHLEKTKPLSKNNRRNRKLSKEVQELTRVVTRIC